MQSEQVRARFEAAEAAAVLASFELESVRSIREYKRGSSQSPKVVIDADSGRYLLKRRVHERGLHERLLLTVSAHQACQIAGLPVARMVPLRGSQDRILVRDGLVYELFEFIPGRRYSRNEEQSQSAGQALASLHQVLGAMSEAGEGRPDQTYHDSKVVRSAIGRVPQATEAAGAKHDGSRLAAVVHELEALYETAAAQCAKPLHEWGGIQLIHGDYHPGNVLFDGPSVRAILDFDSVRRGCPLLDIANGAMQFALVKMEIGVPMEHWPCQFELERLRAFMVGYAKVSPGIKSAGRCDVAQFAAILPPLMIEAMVGESIIPVVRTGTFGGINALEFLEFVVRKARWVAAEHTLIVSTIAATLDPARDCSRA